MTNQTITKRKSIRKYDTAKLDDITLDKIRDKIKALTPLYPSIRYSVEIAGKTKGLFNVKAPHYLLFYSEESESFRFAKVAGVPERKGFIYTGTVT